MKRVQMCVFYLKSLTLLTITIALIHKSNAAPIEDDFQTVVKQLYACGVPAQSFYMTRYDASSPTQFEASCMSRLREAPPSHDGKSDDEYENLRMMACRKFGKIVLFNLCDPNNPHDYTKLETDYYQFQQQLLSGATDSQAQMCTALGTLVGFNLASDYCAKMCGDSPNSNQFYYLCVANTYVQSQLASKKSASDPPLSGAEINPNPAGAEAPAKPAANGETVIPSNNANVANTDAGTFAEHGTQDGQPDASGGQPVLDAAGGQPVLDAPGNPLTADVGSTGAVGGNPAYAPVSDSNGNVGNTDKTVPGVPGVNTNSGTTGAVGAPPGSFNPGLPANSSPLTNPGSQENPVNSNGGLDGAPVSNPESQVPNIGSVPSSTGITGQNGQVPPGSNLPVVNTGGIPQAEPAYDPGSTGYKSPVADPVMNKPFDPVMNKPFDNGLATGNSNNIVTSRTEGETFQTNSGNPGQTGAAGNSDTGIGSPDQGAEVGLDTNLDTGPVNTLAGGYPANPESPKPEETEFTHPGETNEDKDFANPENNQENTGLGDQATNADKGVDDGQLTNNERPEYDGLTDNDKQDYGNDKGNELPNEDTEPAYGNEGANDGLTDDERQEYPDNEPSESESYDEKTNEDKQYADFKDKPYSDYKGKQYDDYKGVDGGNFADQQNMNPADEDKNVDHLYDGKEALVPQQPGAPAQPEAPAQPYLPQQPQIPHSYNREKEALYELEEESSSSHFLAYSLTAIILIMATYLLYHNKQKIIAIIIEGKNPRARRRRGDGYAKLDQNVSEAMPSLQEQSASTKDYTF